VFEVGCEHMRDGFAPLLLTRCVRRALALACAVEAGQVQTWARDQGGEYSRAALAPPDRGVRSADRPENASETEIVLPLLVRYVAAGDRARDPV
jgi:hypothetical protein